MRVRERVRVRVRAGGCTGHEGTCDRSHRVRVRVCG